MGKAFLIWLHPKRTARDLMQLNDACSKLQKEISNAQKENKALSDTIISLQGELKAASRSNQSLINELRISEKEIASLREKMNRHNETSEAEEKQMR